MFAHCITTQQVAIALDAGPACSRTHRAPKEAPTMVAGEPSVQGFADDHKQ